MVLHLHFTVSPAISRARALKNLYNFQVFRIHYTAVVREHFNAMDIQTNLATLRARRGLGAAELAAQVGVSRQTIYAIEAGTYIPNTSVSLRLANALETTVEDIFQLAPPDKAPDEVVQASIVGNEESMKPGHPVQLCVVNGKFVAVVAEPGTWGLPPADAVLLEVLHKGKQTPLGKIRLLGDRWKKPSRILLAGCDPSVSFLTQSMHAQGSELLVTYANSTRALDLLRDGLVHIAGSHLVNKATGKTDLLPITRGFKANSVAVICYAEWDEGLVTAPGNPKNIHGIADLARKDVRFTNREAGAGCRRLLDDLLKKNHISAGAVNGYDRTATGHLAAARMVLSGEADCCISTQAVALGLALNFIPLASKPYHFVLKREHLILAPIQTMLDIIRRTSFRREVEACTGYSMRTAADRIL